MQTEPSQAMTEPELADKPAAPQTWQDLVRQHISGPVFSLAFHIIALVLLGTLVVIVPNAGKDDIEPVQIAELEPVLPPPEEEPTPSDMTVMDTSNPALDRYESNLQQMEDVGVNDVEIMTDIDIPTPLAIPNSNSALKLQGVLPFGHRGGGEMGDGGDGDGRGNTIGELQGVFYDLKQTRDRRPTDDFRSISSGGWKIERVPPLMKVMRPFVNGSWRREYDAQGKVHYPELDRYFSPSDRLWIPYFYTADTIQAELAPQALGCEKEVDPCAWVCIYSGNVVAPFSGKFRFVGAADDVMFVRFNKEIVLDYGCASYSAGEFWIMERNASNLRSLKSDSRNEIRSRSSLYSKQKLDVYPARSGGAAYDLAKGLPISVVEGQVYPIEVLVSEIPGGDYSQALYIERLDDNNQPLMDDSSGRMTLFRTTLDLPEQPKRNFPEFNPYGPIFRVVRSNTSSGGGSGSGGLIGNRTSPRTARVNEDDDDLSL